MWKDIVLGLVALGLLAASNLNLCCRVSVDGRELSGLYTPAAVDAAAAAAEAAAEEILPGKGAVAKTEREYTLSFVAPRGLSSSISDAMLRSTTGVASVSGVYVDGVRLGCVGDGDELRRELDSFIVMQRPTKAVRSLLNGQLVITPFYSRAGDETNCGDMVLLITGMAHVMYMDENGKFV